MLTRQTQIFPISVAIILIMKSLLFSMNASAEVADITVTAASNIVEGLRFDVAFKESSIPQVQFVVVAVSPQSNDVAPTSMYVELKDDRRLLAAGNMERARPEEVPRDIRDTLPKNALYFLFKVDRALIKTSWVALRVSENRLCTLRLGNWLKGKNP